MEVGALGKLRLLNKDYNSNLVTAIKQVNQYRDYFTSRELKKIENFPQVKQIALEVNKSSKTVVVEGREFQQVPL